MLNYIFAGVLCYLVVCLTSCGSDTVAVNHNASPCDTASFRGGPRIDIYDTSTIRQSLTSTRWHVLCNELVLAQIFNNTLYVTFREHDLTITRQDSSSSTFFWGYHYYYYKADRVWWPQIKVTDSSGKPMNCDCYTGHEMYQEYNLTAKEFRIYCHQGVLDVVGNCRMRLIAE